MSQGDAGSSVQDLLRQLPSIDSLLNTSSATQLVAEFGRALTVESLRVAITSFRRQILAGGAVVAEPENVIIAATEALHELIAPTLTPVINATGVIVHTNLGRAPLALSALAAISSVAAGYATLEYDAGSGRRGSRSVHAEQLLKRITGAEAALTVNNCAAAVVLMLVSFCQGREVIISRGQLVEIGGGFRIPDIMKQSGAVLVEVGTTNRTHLRDYENAIGENTAAILVAHHSNYKIIGFTSEPPLDELAALAHANGLPLLYDQGSGALLDTGRFGIETEPPVPAGVAAGCDVIAFSGDKLLGGPQAGILVGREVLIGRMRRHPFARAIRPDKLCLAGLSATLTHYLKGDALTEVPVWQMIAASLDTLYEQALRWCEALTARGVSATVQAGASTIGGGSLPGQTLPSVNIVLEDYDAEAVAARLRMGTPPVIGRISEDRLLLDPRTVLPHQETALLEAVCAAVG